MISRLVRLEETSSLSDLVVRVRGNGAVTKYYDVISLSLSGSKYVVRVEGQFGSEVDSVTGGGNASTQTRKGISIEIAQNVTKNKPEYEGRFFVKVYRDRCLETNILSRAQIQSIQLLQLETYLFLKKVARLVDLGGEMIGMGRGFF